MPVIESWFYVAVVQTESYPVRIISQPRDPLYPVYVFLTFAAVVVALLTLVAIWQQTKRLGDQVKQMIRGGEQTDRLIAETTRHVKAAEDNASAALLNAKAVIEAERAWVILSLEPSTNPIVVGISAENLGRTPAEIISWHAAFIFPAKATDMPAEPEYGIGEYEPTIVLPSKSARHMDGWNFPEIIPQETATEARLGKKKIIWYGRIEYFDILQKRHETRFCYWYDVANHTCVPYGPPEYRLHN